MNKSKTVRLSEAQRKLQFEEQETQNETNETTQETGLESRKRFYEEHETSIKHEAKRNKCSEFCQMLLHPIEYFRPKETKVSELKFEINQLKNGEIEIVVLQYFNGKSYQLGVLRINENSDIEESMKQIEDEIHKWTYNNLTIEELKELKIVKSNVTRLPSYVELSDIRTGKTKGKIVNENIEGNENN